MLESVDVFYGGGFHTTRAGIRVDLVDPSTEEAFASVGVATADDVDPAVDAAQTAFDDWAGLTFADIAKATQSVLTDRMVKHYAAGVQPLYWRGEAMIVLWCKSLRADRAALPMCEIVRGHRVTPSKANPAPVLRSLPAWPPSPAVAVEPGKRKYTRRVVEV